MRVTKSENRVLRMFRAVAVFEAFIFGIAYAICIKIPPAEGGLGSYFWVAGILIALHFLMFFIKGNRFVRIIHKWVAKIGNDDINGDWELVISYHDIGRETSRYGPCKIESSFLGVKIYGDKIFDSSTKKVELEDWVAEKADIVYYENKEILFYLYVTYENDPNNPTKFGMVNAEKKGDDVYEGYFRDLQVDSGKTTRQGKVVLTKAKVKKRSNKV